MGAVFSYDDETCVDPVLLPPEGRAFGSQMGLEVARYLRDVHSKARVAYGTEIMAKGEPFDRYAYDFAIAARVAVPEEMFPPKVIVKTGVTIPDFYSNFGFLFVSDAFKALVQDFDGDIHQFVPVEIVDANGAPYTKSGFSYFKSRQVLDTVDETSERLDFSHHQTARPGDPSPFTYTHRSPFRVFKDKVGSAGIWRELRCLYGYFASEAFLARAQAQGLTGIFRYTDFEEVRAV